MLKKSFGGALFYFFALAGVVLCFSDWLPKASVLAQENYRLPPEEVVDIIDAPPPPSVSFSPDGEWMLLTERDAMPSLEEISRRMLRLAGLRIDPAANSRFRTSYNRSVSLRKTSGSEPLRVQLPADAKLASTRWSHRSDGFVITTVDDTGTTLWYASVDNPQTPRKLAGNLNTVTTGLNWMPDAQSIICCLVPEDRGEEPAAPTVPAGPNIQESSGNESPTRTYQDLLKSPYDEALFDYYATSQLVQIDLQGNVRKIRQPAIYRNVSISPNGEHLLIATIQSPYSYLLTMQSFPQTIEVVDLQGEREFLVAEVPLAENIPIEGVRTGRRNVGWRSCEPAALVWTEALDGGDPRREVAHRDQIFRFPAPFNGSPSELAKVEHRAMGLTDFEDPKWFATSEYDRDRRWIRTLLYRGADDDNPAVLMDRSIRDRYGDPGRIASRVLDNGQSVVRQDGEWIYRTGQGASPQGNLPFIDRQNLRTLETERLWRAEEGTYESVVKILESSADNEPVIITSKETPLIPPNYFAIDLGGDQRTALTDFPDPTPQIRGIKKQLVKYERPDGVPLSATLYLPADYQEGTRLPLLVWAYPREYNDVRTAGQVASTPTRFTRMSSISHLTLLTQGYAIMDSATMPVIGDPETMNDTFIEQIVAAAQAAIDKAVAMGVADGERVAVGGHSYGAFMTANLLAHCDLFRAGIARSGAYNRTLTPFGFQSERRKLWDAKDVYFNISPFMHANKINEPLLLIHGEADNNSGTFPMQSRRLYQAIKGNGGTVRLVMLPYESHGYRARESIMHTQAEMIDWLNQYVKDPQLTDDTDSADSPAGSR